MSIAIGRGLPKPLERKLLDGGEPHTEGEALGQIEQGVEFLQRLEIVRSLLEQRGLRFQAFSHGVFERRIVQLQMI